MKRKPDHKYDIIAVGQASVDDIFNNSYSATGIVGGGAVYVTTIAASLKLRSGLVTRLGDHDAERYLSILQSAGVDTEGVHVEPGPSTRVILHYNGEDLEDVSVIEGVGGNLSETDIPEGYFSTDILYLAPAPYDTHTRVAELAKHKEVLVAFGPHADYNDMPFPAVEKVLRNVDMFFANEEETLALSGEHVLEQALRKIRAAGPTVVVATQGKAGATILSDEGFVKVVALSPKQLVDVVGAGDAFVSGFLAGLYAGLRLSSCGVLGAATASCVLEGIGLEVIPTLRMVRETLERNGISVSELQRVSDVALFGDT